MNNSTYPVHVDAHLDPHVSRWLWLVKWLLVLPHYVVLAFLWLAFVVLSVAAFAAILVTGRYPAAIFDFNVGVLRWSWRVAFYAYGALGTDRYPPFTLAEVPDYPAHLSVDYPEHLSRGLVLVKWWLLAIPHYVVLAIFLGGGLYLARDPGVADAAWTWSGGLIGLFVLVAAVVLLVTGRYPQPLYDLVLGMNRWVLRVAAYSALMTDAYPPFRLDQGADEPGEGGVRMAPPPPAPRPAAGPPSPPPRGAGWTAGRVVSLVVGCVVLALSAGLGIGGLALGAVDLTQRDQDGFLSSSPERIGSQAWAVTTSSIQVEMPRWVSDEVLGDLRVTAASSDGPVFLGIARTSDVQAYLADVGHSEIVGFTGGYQWWGDWYDDGTPVYDVEPGARPAVPPTASDIWTATASGSGEQVLQWEPRTGDWSVVLMNADGSRPVSADVTAGAEVPHLGTVALVMVANGVVALALGLALVLGAVRSARRR